MGGEADFLTEKFCFCQNRARAIVETSVAMRGRDQAPHVGVVKEGFTGELTFMLSWVSRVFSHPAARYNSVLVLTSQS